MEVDDSVTGVDVAVDSPTDSVSGLIGEIIGHANLGARPSGGGGSGR